MSLQACNTFCTFKCTVLNLIRLFILNVQVYLPMCVLVVYTHLIVIAIIVSLLVMQNCYLKDLKVLGD